MLHVPAFTIAVTADSHDELMRLLCNELFEHPLVPIHVRSRIENSVRMATVGMKRGESVSLELHSTLDVLGLGSLEIAYRHFETPERGPGM